MKLGDDFMSVCPIPPLPPDDLLIDCILSCCLPQVFFFFSGHLTLYISLRQLLMKVCILLWITSVFLQVSEPCKRTDFTLELTIRIFVVVLISFDAQMFFSTTKAALAFLILAITSLSVPLCLSTILPRYTNDSTSLIWWLVVYCNMPDRQRSPGGQADLGVSTVFNFS